MRDLQQRRLAGAWAQVRAPLRSQGGCCQRVPWLYAGTSRNLVPVLRLAKQPVTSSCCSHLPSPTSAQQPSSPSLCSVLLVHVWVSKYMFHAVFQRLNTSDL